MDTAAHTPFELLFDQLRDLYSMEVQLRDTIPNLVSQCTNKKLRDLIFRHADQNCDQIAEVTLIFERHGESPGHDKCKAMEGLIEGGSAHLEGVRSPQVRDLMMVAHCLRIKYYEMAAYRYATLLSRRLGLMCEPAILSELLVEEKEMAAARIQLEPELFGTAISRA